MPLVSVITPAYRAAHSIGETIASVQAQTFRDWEMLIADDCSPDDTAAVVAAIAAKDPRVVLVRMPRNGGPALARQAALDASSGRYAAFLDADDLWLPGKLEKQMQFMNERGAALSYTEFRRIEQDGGKVGRVMPVPPSLTYDELLKNTAIATLTVMIDRQITGPLRMRNEPYDDLCLWLDVLRAGRTAYGLPMDLARYRVSQGSVSSKPLRSASWVWHIYRDVERLSLPRSAWCFCHWAVRAWKKRLTF